MMVNIDRLSYHARCAAFVIRRGLRIMFNAAAWAGVMFAVLRFTDNAVMRSCVFFASFFTLLWMLCTAKASVAFRTRDGVRIRRIK